MDKISTIKQNILYFVENQGFKREEFFDKIEISYSNFKGKSLFSEIGADKLVKILTNFPQINPDWLLTGKGEMLRNEYAKREQTHNIVSEPNNDYSINKNDFKEKLIEVLQTQNSDLRNDKIELQKDKIELQKDKELLSQIINNKMGKEKSA